MTIDDRYGSSQSQGGQSQTGAATGTVRSAEYDDGLIVQDTNHSAAPTAGVVTPRHLDNRDGYGRDRSDVLAADESGTLISSDKVVGTAVYDASGERLGTIDSIMLNKRSGKVAFAVMSFGGFLGIGERYHPLPWNVLTYDEAKGGYNIDHSADDLRRAPNYSRGEVDTLDYARSGGEIDDYYGVNVAEGAATETGTLAETPSYNPVSRRSTGIVAADDIGSTSGAGSSGIGSTGMGSNRNF